MRMNINLNNQVIDVFENISIKSLVESHVEVTDFAIAVNHNFIPREKYDDYILQSNDNVELLVPMQGG
jgi:thiamine biosynthesis protein ThiS